MDYRDVFGWILGILVKIGCLFCWDLPGFVYMYILRGLFVDVIDVVLVYWCNSNRCTPCFLCWNLPGLIFWQWDLNQKKKASCWVHAWCLRPIIGKLGWFIKNHHIGNMPTCLGKQTTWTINWPLIMSPHTKYKQKRPCVAYNLHSLILQAICTISSLKCRMDQKKVEKKCSYTISILNPKVMEVDGR